MAVINYVEWLPCAGKSLLIKALEKNKCEVVHELWRVLDKKDFPWNWKSLEEIKNIDNWFIDKEWNRYIWLPSSSKNVYFDRSFLTHLTYAYAYSRFMNIPSFKDTVLKYKQAIDDGYLLSPDVIINIKVPSDISIQRQNGKIAQDPNKALPYFWRNKQFLNDLLYAYSKLYESYIWNFIELDGKLTTEEKLAQVLNAPVINPWKSKIDLDYYLTKML